MARNEQDKESFLEILANTPFINHACKKAGISRATVYRLIKDDYRFKQKVNRALKSGRVNLVEVAETVLVKKIQAGEFGPIKFFLSHNSKRYQNNSDIEEAELEKEEKSSSFIGSEGMLLITKHTNELLEEQDKEERDRKSRAMG